MNNTNEVLRILEDDFDTCWTPAFGNGYFCTPDVFEQLKAALSTPDPEPDARLRTARKALELVLRDIKQYERQYIRDETRTWVESALSDLSALTPTPIALSQTVTWIPVEDELPEKNVDVIISRGQPDDEIEIGYYRKTGKWMIRTLDGNAEVHGVTHWMGPLKSAQELEALSALAVKGGK